MTDRGYLDVQQVQELQAVAEAVVASCSEADHAAKTACEHQEWLKELHVSLQSAEAQCQQAEEAEASCAQEAEALLAQGVLCACLVEITP